MIAAACAARPAFAERVIQIAELADPWATTVVIPAVAGDLSVGPITALDSASDGAVSAALSTAGFKGEEGETLALYGIADLEKLLVVGLGDKRPDAQALENFGGQAAQAIDSLEISNIDILWTGIDANAAHPGASIAYGAALGQYTFEKYKTDNAPVGGRSLTIRTVSAESDRQAFDGVWRPVAEAVHFARDLINEPGNVLYPESFVERTREAFAGLDDVSIEVLDENDMAELGMGALLGVGQGSIRPPRLLIVRYNGKDGQSSPLVFAGKGVTFDTGGISIKPSSGMWRMKYDMSGAAAVVGGVLALARRGADVNAFAIAALAENMPSDRAQRPGDIVRTMSGKTIEVLNTDAEGRLMLTDTVYYAQQEFNPEILLDFATLTGSVRVALGDEYAGLFTRHDALAGKLIESGAKAGEPVWQLPLHPSYAEDIRSEIADIKNISGERLAGAGIGAQVIGTFVDEETVWAHLDIASMAWPSLGTPTVPNRGGSGYGVRLINQFVLDHYESGAD
jgi:leucyl aminopeptidase